MSINDVTDLLKLLVLVEVIVLIRIKLVLLDVGEVLLQSFVPLELGWVNSLLVLVVISGVLLVVLLLDDHFTVDGLNFSLGQGSDLSFETIDGKGLGGSNL